MIEPSLAEKICRQLTAGLPEWFGIPEANERYAKGCLERISFAATIDNQYVGLVVLEFPFANNANIYWMAVDKAYHGQTIGHQLLQAAEKYCFAKNISSLTVETLSPKQKDPFYTKTYQFYDKCGFIPLFELEPYGPDLLMCYMQKSIFYGKTVLPSLHKKSTNYIVRKLEENDITLIVSSFYQIGWDKPHSLFQQYLKEQQNEKRFIWVVFYETNFVGYVTLKLNSEYHPFKDQNTPEINDLNVLPHYRNQGIGTILLDMAENQAQKISHMVGIGVGLYPDYGAAQRLYVKRGYIPNGKGITYQYKGVIAGHEYKVDDDLILWFEKRLKVGSSPGSTFK